jgi:hypothetical protein
MTLSTDYLSGHLPIQAVLPTFLILEQGFNYVAKIQKKNKEANTDPGFNN